MKPTEEEKLKSYARRASIALGFICGGGSEMFEQIGEEYYYNPELAKERYFEKEMTRVRLEQRKRPLAIFHKDD